MDPNKLKIAVICPRADLFPFVVRRLRTEGKMYVAQLKFETPTTIYFLVHHIERVYNMRFHGIMYGPLFYEVREAEKIIAHILHSMLVTEETVDDTIERLSKPGYQICPPDQK